MKKKEQNKKDKTYNRLSSYFKIFVGFVIGIIVSCSVVYVTAEKLINSSEVKYDNSSSGLTSTNVQAAIEELNTNATDYATVISRLNNIVNVVYPVGSIYISTSSTNPGTLFGGTWQAFGTGRTLVGINTSDGDFNSVEKTGGEKSHTLTAAESGQKNLGAITSSNNNRGHTHTRGTMNITGTAYLSTTEAGYNTVVSANGALSTAVEYVVNDGSSQSRDFSTISTSATYRSPITLNASKNWTGATSDENQKHTHTVTISGSNASSAHNNLQPYITVYMWKRTA